MFLYKISKYCEISMKFDAFWHCIHDLFRLQYPKEVEEIVSNFYFSISGTHTTILHTLTPYLQIIFQNFNIFLHNFHEISYIYIYSKHVYLHFVAWHWRDIDETIASSLIHPSIWLIVFVTPAACILANKERTQLLLFCIAVLPIQRWWQTKLQNYIRDIHTCKRRISSKTKNCTGSCGHDVRVNKGIFKYIQFPPKTRIISYSPSIVAYPLICHTITTTTKSMHPWINLLVQNLVSEPPLRSHFRPDFEIWGYLFDPRFHFQFDSNTLQG